mgnify:CR=1 FL=1
MWQWLSGFLSSPQIWGEVAKRSGHWGFVRDLVLKDANCAACGGWSQLEVHHIQPFHVRPDLELEPGNLIPLCRPCHYHLGHLKCWQCINPDVVQDAAEYRAKIAKHRGPHHGNN